MVQKHYTIYITKSIPYSTFVPYPQQGNLIKYTRIYSTIYPYIVRSIPIEENDCKDTSYTEVY